MFVSELSLRRRLVYPVLLLLVCGSWATWMHSRGLWHLFADYWQASVTMVFGSFVAGSTPAGGASVAFPVFTKLLEIPSPTAAVFGLMIQSVGMTMAGVLILSRSIPFYVQVYRWAALGGSLAIVPAVLFLRVPAPFPKLLFTCLVFSFGIVLLRVWWRGRGLVDAQPCWGARERLHLFITGAVGGVLASQLGSGADMLVFVTMVLAYRLPENRAVPTTILVMATVSVVGFAAKVVVQPAEIGGAWDLWLACVPIVAIGAPLGAWVIAHLPPKAIVAAVLVLISLEVVSTLLVLDLGAGHFLLMAGMVGLAFLWFRFLLAWRA